MNKKNIQVLSFVCFFCLVNVYCQDASINKLFGTSPIINVNFYISDNVLPKNRDIGTGKIVNMSCEVHFNFNDSTKIKIITGIDSVHDATEELIGNCYNSNNFYDSYLLCHHRDNTKTKMIFLCKDYSKALVRIGQYRGYVCFKPFVSDMIKDIAEKVRLGMCPCSAIK